MVARLTGGCFCGGVRYAVDDAFGYALNCHCGNCRRATGAAFKPIAGIARDRLAITHGAAMLQRVYGAAGDWWSEHCLGCGTLLYAVVRDGSFLHVAMGTLIDAPTIRPTHHVFVGSKAAWFTITDDLPQYDGTAPATRV